MYEPDSEALRSKLAELRTEHRDLDDVIERLSQDAAVDQLLLKRLKKRKLLIKDMMTRIESQPIPDLDA
jgi:hypothetical protein